jgi:hypothetical protein
MTKFEKPLKERLSEGIRLLTQLADVLVGQNPNMEAKQVVGYDEVQAVISEWTKTGKAWDGRIDFPGCQRYAELSLPRSATLTATLAFKRQ